MATITNPGGNSAFGQLQLRVYGMTLAQMNEFSSDGANMVAVQNQSVTVIAGNQGDSLEQVFSGTLISSYIDLSSVPDVCFTCAAVAGYYNKAAPAAPNTYKGAQNAEDIIQALASSIGYAFENPNNAHAVVQNQYLSGSVVDQMQAVARAASIPLVIENKTVTIWPNNGTRDDVVIDLSAETGLVGYPSYWEAGFTVKSEFNPVIAIGRIINLTSQLPKANGQFPVQYVTHELSTLTPDGPWFTTSKLSPSVYVATN
ncbi:MAG: hypothetical protein B7Z19_06795 [Polynucleobacter sp. 32-46-5]|nr:MAG: hypothetical protein B7Z19_06795 [Polynucleobacter sp. 32-46-5]